MVIYRVKFKFNLINQSYVYCIYYMDSDNANDTEEDDNNTQSIYQIIESL